MKQQLVIYGAANDGLRNPAAGVPAVCATLPEEITLAANEECSLVLIVLPESAKPAAGRLAPATPSDPEAAPATTPAELSLRVKLTGRGAAFRFHALCLGTGSDHFSLRTEVEHLCPDASSDQLIRCIAGGNSRLSFDGLIKVHPDAQRTQALQTSNNLLLTDTAKVATAPQLEIYADDVKCSHGATTGSLDEEEQFYMRSRGISLEKARLLQLRSFVHPVLEAVEDEKRREELTSFVAEALSAL
ncbi:MAG: SufD family Fe-S cluster assembly protein [Bacteroidales bacterium]|nr:SufD family Fe-S cluster assembly protein [Bacteroidales bacterium]